MEIRLIETSVLELHLTPSEQGAKDVLRFSPLYRDEHSHRFAVLFDVKAVLKSAVLSLKYYAVFECTDEITDDFRASHFPKVNAPAVAYPYVRAFVSQFSALTTGEAFTLPIRNFVKSPLPQVKTLAEGATDASELAFTPSIPASTPQ